MIVREVAEKSLACGKDCHVCWVITRYWRCERIRQHLPRARCKGHLKNRNTPVHVEDHFGHGRVSIPHQGETEGRQEWFP